MIDAPFLRDRAALLLAAGRASETLEHRCDAASSPTITMAADELREIAEQFQRVVSILTVVHVAEAQAVKDAAQDRSVA